MGVVCLGWFLRKCIIGIGFEFEDVKSVGIGG